MKVVTCGWAHSCSYKIPKGIELKNKEQVKNWFLKYNELVIILTNGKTIEIQPYIENGDDYKWPIDETIEIEDVYSEYSDSDSDSDSDR